MVPKIIKRTAAGAGIGALFVYAIMCASLSEESMGSDAHYFAELMALKIGAGVGSLGGLLHHLWEEDSKPGYSSTLFQNRRDNQKSSSVHYTHQRSLSF